MDNNISGKLNMSYESISDIDRSVIDKSLIDYTDLDNAIVCQYKDITVYESDIQLLEDQYIHSLPDENDIYNVSCFRGLLVYIYRRLLKNVIRKEIDNYNAIDFRTIEIVFDNIYIPLTTKYKKTPLLSQFITSLCHMNYDTIELILSGNESLMLADNELTKIRLNTFKRLYNICQSATLERAQEDNSIGSIFISKAVYGKTDNNPQTIQLQVLPEDKASPEQIAAKYRDIQIPEKPDFS